MLICGPLGAVTVTAPALPGGREVVLRRVGHARRDEGQRRRARAAPPLIVNVQCAISPSEMTLNAALCITTLT